MNETKTITYEAIYEIVGNRCIYLKDLVEFIKVNYDTDGVFKYSNKSGWTIFYKKSGKPLMYANIKEGGFTVTVVIGVSLADKVYKSGVNQKTVRMFETAKQYFDGRWLSFEVQNQAQIEDIKKLLLLKKNPVKKN